MTGDTWGGFLTKPSRTARRIKERKKRLDLDRAEDRNKADVRRRDKFCRFPLCGCRRLKLRTEVSHHIHKGAGGNPKGDRSVSSLMVLLCLWRHQEGVVSRHKGTLRPKFLTRQKFNGPIAWEVERDAALWAIGALPRGKWVEVARESSIGIFEPFQGWQYDVLKKLGEMAL